MIRGTTPTFIFELPFDCSELTACSVAFAQDGKVLVEKVLTECEKSGNTLTVTLSEEETLLFDCTKRIAEIQIRGGCGKKRLASDILVVNVGRILKDGCLIDDET